MRPPSQGIATVVTSALPDEEIIQASPLATVTTNFVVLRDPEGQSHMIISLSHLSGVRKIRTSHPGLLVIAAAFFLISAAALCSKEGHGTDIPLAIIGLAFIIAYVLSRRASVAFVAGSAMIETEQGALAEAAAVISAVESARTNAKPERQRSAFRLKFEPTRT